MMKKNKIEPTHIHLIEISENITLFFHTETLQIYPIKDKLILDFLKDFKNFGNKILNNKNQEIYEFISETIANAPHSTKIISENVNATEYQAIVLPISAKCNLNCPYCFAQTESGFNFNDFTEEDIDSIVKFLAKKINIKSNLQLFSLVENLY